VASRSWLAFRAARIGVPILVGRFSRVSVSRSDVFAARAGRGAGQPVTQPPLGITAAAAASALGERHAAADLGREVPKGPEDLPNSDDDEAVHAGVQD
jgi:hypothetical protein